LRRIFFRECKALKNNHLRLDANSASFFGGNHSLHFLRCGSSACAKSAVLATAAVNDAMERLFSHCSSQLFVVIVLELLLSQKTRMLL
jgi:hypothetical protein